MAREGESFTELDAPKPWPGESLRELVEAYGAAMARAALRLVTTGVDAAAPYAERAEALKVEILKRYEGNRS